MKYTQEKLEKIADKLREMPEVKGNREHSKQESVKILYKEIADMQKRGYTLEQIAEVLSGEGLQITTPTLKSYLQRAKPASKKRTTQQAQADEQENKKEVTRAENPGQRGVTERGREGVQKATFTPKEDSEDI